MATTTKKKALMSAMLMGAVSIGMYALLFVKQDLVNGTFGKGGMYALLPLVTAFAFSFVHGSFTGNFWTALGIEAAKGKGGK
ncbi:MAG: hypothetical protein WBA53_11735 [Burkholderiaceae bacterium]